VIPRAFGEEHKSFRRTLLPPSVRVNFRRNSSHYNSSGTTGWLFICNQLVSQSVRGPLADKEPSNVLIRPSRPCATWHKLRFRMSARFFVDTVRGENVSKLQGEDLEHCRSTVHTTRGSVILTTTRTLCNTKSASVRTGHPHTTC
jgi:hypothetical protein